MQTKLTNLDKSIEQIVQEFQASQSTPVRFTVNPITEGEDEGGRASRLQHGGELLRLPPGALLAADKQPA